MHAKDRKRLGILLAMVRAATFPSAEKRRSEKRTHPSNFCRHGALVAPFSLRNHPPAVHNGPLTASNACGSIKLYAHLSREIHLTQISHTKTHPDSPPGARVTL